MGTPQRVAQEAAEAEATLQQLAGNVPPAPAPATPAQAPQDQDPNVPPTPAPPADGFTPNEPAPSVAPTTPESELQRLQQQLQTEAGRRLAQETQLAELNAKIQQLESRPAPQAPAPAPAPAPTFVTDEDVADYGQDMLDFIGRVIQQNLTGVMNQFAGRLQRLESQAQQISQMATTSFESTQEIAEREYFGDLAKQVPDWETINNSEDFLAWLKNRDTFSRKTRHELLTAAHNEADASTVAEFFKAYKQEKGMAPAAPATTSQNAQTPGTVDPANLVAPTSANAPAPSLNPRNGKIWTQAEIEQVYDDRMKKRISQEKFAELEADIEKAMLEGRVQ